MAAFCCRHWFGQHHLEGKGDEEEARDGVWQQVGGGPEISGRGDRGDLTSLVSIGMGVWSDGNELRR